MSDDLLKRRRLPVGAEALAGGGGTHFRVWAPRRRNVVVVFGGGKADASSDVHRLTPEGDGYFSGLAPPAGDGTLSRFRLDGDDHLYPDPVSRFQPEGPHGPSQVVDHRAFRWSDDNWPGIGPEGQVLYEMHVGTFTKEGTW